MIPSMTMKALDNLQKAMADGDFSEGWKHECTNHPMALEGTTGFEIKACPEYKDFIASLYLGSTRKGTVMRMDVAIEKIDTGYEGQSLTDADPHVRLVSCKVPTWPWAWGGISVLVGDAKAHETGPLDEEEEEFEEEECARIPEKTTLDKWFEKVRK